MSAYDRLKAENDDLRARLAEAEDALRAIREGHVDAIVVDSAQGEQIFSLTGAETMYRLAVETMAEAVINVSLDGKILFCNTRFAEFVGTPMEKLLGRDLSEFVADPDRKSFLALLRQCEKQPAQRRVVFTNPANVQKAVHLTCNVMSQAEGRTLLLVGSDLTELEMSAQQIDLLQHLQVKLQESRRTALNIMEDALVARQQAEQAADALRRNEMRMQHALNASRSFTFEWMPATDQVRRSTSCGNILDLIGEDSLRDTGQSYFQHIHPEDRARFVELVSTLTPTRPGYTTEYRYVRGNGSIVTLEETGQGEFDATGELTRLVGVCTDVTARRQAEESLRHERNLLQVVLNSARNFHLVYLDRNFNFVRVNETYARTCGYRPEEMIGKNHFALYPNAENEAIFVRVRDTGESFEVHDKPFVFPDKPQGDVTYWDWSLTPIKDATGKVEGLVFALLETTERKMAEKALQEAMTAAKAANRAKDHFMATLSHELRTPLTPVMVALQMLEKDPNLTAHQREDLAMIHRNLMLEVRLIDDLLDLNRIARGKIDLHKRPLDLHLKLQNVQEICKPDILAKGLTLVLDLQAQRHDMLGDPGRLQQVFWNLVKNAIKFTPSGGSITIRSSNPQPNCIRVEVTDTGLGLEPQAMDRLFVAFEQGNRDITRQYGGMGLGLAICKNLVELHGGVIRAQSRGKDQGASFIVELPVIESSSQEKSQLNLRDLSDSAVNPQSKIQN